TKLLRAATYGRGIWQFPLTTNPDFQLAVPSPIQTGFVGDSVIYSGALASFNGYNSPVRLTCTAGGTPLPSACNVTPSTVTPSAIGAAFIVSAGGPAGDYTFKLHAVGTDPNALTHDATLTLHIFDFNLSVPNPTSASVLAGANSDPIALQVSAQGGFD